MGMTAEDAAQRLFRVGIACFIRDFGWLLDAGRSNSNVPAVDFLHETYAYTVAASRTRVPKARKIMTNKMALCSCLEYISCKAGRIPSNTREKAQKLREERQQEWKIREPFGKTENRVCSYKQRKALSAYAGSAFVVFWAAFLPVRHYDLLIKRAGGREGSLRGGGPPLALGEGVPLP